LAKRWQICGIPRISFPAKVLYPTLGRINIGRMTSTTFQTEDANAVSTELSVELILETFQIQESHETSC